MNTDEIITLVTEATSREAALAALVPVSRPSLLAVADQIYVDDADVESVDGKLTSGRSSAWLRKAIVNEARS